MKKQDILTLISQGWRVSYNKDSMGKIRNGIALKGNSSKGIDARWIHTLFTDGVIEINTETSNLTNQKMYDLTRVHGFAGIVITDAERAEMAEDNVKAASIGSYGRLRFRLTTV